MYHVVVLALVCIARGLAALTRGSCQKVRRDWSSISRPKYSTMLDNFYMHFVIAMVYMPSE
jgi:hypothetical protein